MRHQVRTNKLGRNKAHRKALLRNMANSMIKHGKIKTTKAKAKALKKFIEPLITRAKENTLHNRRVVYSKIRNKKSIIKLFEILGPKFKERPGGYTRRFLLGKRKSDSSEMSLVLFVDDTEEEKKDKKEKKKK